MYIYEFVYSYIIFKPRNIVSLYINKQKRKTHKTVEEKHIIWLRNVNKSIVNRMCTVDDAVDNMKMEFNTDRHIRRHRSLIKRKQ